MRLALILAVLSWAVPLAAQDVPVIERPQNGTTIVHYRGESVGLRDNADGTRDSLKAERDWRKGWLGKTLKAHRVGPLPDESPFSFVEPMPAARIAADVVAADTAIVMDVLVVWTPRTETAQGGKTAMEAFAVLLAAIANETYANSGSPNITIRLVGAERIEYVEGTIQTSLSQLTSPTDGFMDAVHTRRNTLGADLVSLIGEGYSSGGLCGIAGSNGFTVVDRLCAAGNLSFPHELGHNQGLNHDPQTVCGAATCSGYNYGHCWIGGRDTLAYPACIAPDGTTVPRKRFFSNPNIFDGGQPTGIANQRDNARVLRERAAIVAATRPTVVSPPPTPKPSKPGKPYPRA